MKQSDEKKITAILNEMTLEEKVALCHANSKFYSSGVERLGIDELAMMDGPHGVRSEPEKHAWTCLNRPEDRCTYLPTETALAATWNPSLARLFGETLGSEARYRGKDIILGPGVNIIRTPLCGRNFEYMSEDPCLIENLAPELVKGIESQDVAACVKHFALNNQELDRGNVNVEVSERALHELYLKGFYAAIIEGGASSVMGAYNRYEHQFCCHNDILVNKILKEQWGFQGVFLSDWAGAHDTEECIFNGLDLEMGTNKPYHEYYLADAFLEKAKQSEEVRRLLDDKVRRILRLMFSVKKQSPDRKKGEFNTEKHQKATYDIAAEAMVLLKNEDHLLPIDRSNLKKILVVGPNADAKHATGGSSSGIRPLYEITPLQGIRDRLSESCEIEYESGKFSLEYKTVPLQNLNIIDLGAGCRNYKQIAYTTEADGKTTKTESICNTANIENGTADSYDVLCSIDIPADGKYMFEFSTNCAAAAKINGKECARICYNQWRDVQKVPCAFAYKKGDCVDVEIRVEKAGDRKIDFQFGWLTPEDQKNTSTVEELLKKAEKADYVLYCGGLDHSLDTEGLDKPHMKLPGEQDMLIQKLIDTNPNTVVVLTAGSPVSMPWINQAKAVLWTWYAGMEGGHVLADILTGEICPSGKMPFTLPKEYADTPVARYGEYQAENCKYNEGILVGYRGFEHDHIEPLFPFGHGISYSKFEYSDLSVKATENGADVTFKVKNTGTVQAKEIAQLYIGDPVCSVMRPPKELKNFKKVDLAPGETAEIRLPVTLRDLSFYDETNDDWKLEKGEFTVFVGSSSRDIRLTTSLQI